MCTYSVWRVLLRATTTLLLSVAALTFAATAVRADTPGPEPRRLEPVDALLELLEQRQIVALGEDHGVAEIHDVFQQIIQDPRLVGKVNDFVVEFGNALYQPVMDRYIAGEHVPHQQLRRAWRDTTQAATEVWESPVYEAFFATVRSVNGKLPRKKRFRVLLGDPPVNWSQIHTPEELLPYQQRDAHFADVVEREVIRLGRRGLIFAGSAHVERSYAAAVPPPGPPSVVAILSARYPGKVGVMLALGMDPEDPAGTGREVLRRLAAWPVGSVGMVHNTWLAELTYLDLMTPQGPVFLRWGDVMDAVIYLGNGRNLAEARRHHLYYVGQRHYLHELQRRASLLSGVSLVNPRQTVYFFHERPMRADESTGTPPP